MVALDDQGAVVRPALLWNDLRSAPQAAEVTERLGGPRACAAAIGSVPTGSFTVTKLRWMSEHEPDNAARTAAVLLPHDYLTYLLGGRAVMTTDHGDASGTGYYSPVDRTWRPDLAAWALRRAEPPALPAIAEPSAVVGRAASGAAVAAGTGDNMAAAFGLGIGPGDVVVSIGTSGTAFCVSATPSAGSDRRSVRVRRRRGRLHAAVLHDQCRPDPHGDRGVARCRPRQPRRTRAVRARRCERHRVAALPGRRAHPEPTERQRGAAWADLGDHPGRSGPGRGGGAAVLVGGRHRRARRGPAAGDRDRRGRAESGGQAVGARRLGNRRGLRRAG